MKTDRYKDWEYKFFEGEELTPEEDLFLKNESDNPYFSFLKDEKNEKMDLSFEEFLKKAEQPKAVTIQVKKKAPLIYWLAASLVVVFGLVVFWIQSPPAHVEKQMAHQPGIKEKTKTKTAPERETIQPAPVLAQAKKPVRKSYDRTRGETNLQNIKLADYQYKENTEHNQIKDEISDYNPNYVIINGKPVYNEAEAIAITEDTFNYFASNVSQTITEAENAQNLSKDLYKIINY